MRAARTLSTVLLAMAMLAPAVVAHGAFQAEAEAWTAATPSPRPPIHIEGDAAFGSPESGVRGGAGTSDDPYVIGGWLVAGSRGAAIRLVNTTAHVVLRDIEIPGNDGVALRPAGCLILGEECAAAIGIHVDNASNVRIERVRVGAAGHAVLIEDSAGIVIDGMTVGAANQAPGSTAFMSIAVTRSRNVEVRNLASFDVTFPVHVEHSDGFTLERSSFSGPAGNTRLHDVSNVTLLGNALDGHGFLLTGPVRNLIAVGNVVRNATQGITSAGAGDDVVSNAFVCGNTFERISTVYGAVGAGFSSDIVVKGNRFVETETAIQLWRSTGVTIERNHVRGTGTSVEGVLVSGGPSTVHNNSFLDIGTYVSFVREVDGRFNWWGAADGPSGAGPGSGSELYADFGATFDPWLTEAPDLTVDCGLPTGPAGSEQALPQGRVEAFAAVEFRAAANGAGTPVEARRRVELPVGPVDFVLP